MTRVAITNTVALNGGDAAIALELVEAVRCALPEARIELHDSQPAMAARYYPWLHWREPLALMSSATRRTRVGGRALRRLNERRLVTAARLWRHSRTRALGSALLRAGERRRIADFAGTDVVVSTGGTYLVERYPLGPRLFEYRMAAALGLPVVFFTQSVGPFRERGNRRALRAAFARSPLVLLRDERSRRHVLELGVAPTRLHVVADAVFGRDSAREIRTRSEAPLRSVAFSVRRWPPGASDTDPAIARFREAVAAAVAWLVRERSAQITLLSTCQGIPEYWTNDADEAARIVERLPGDVRERVTLDAEFHTPAELAEAYARFDLVVATRMHAAILALTAGTPVLPIAYEFKTTELFERMAIGEHVVPIESVEPELLIERVREFADSLPVVAARQQQGVRAERADAQRARLLLADALRRHV